MWLWIRNFFWAFLVCVFIEIAFRPSSTVLGIIFFVLWVLGGKADQARRKRRELEQEARRREEQYSKVQDLAPEDRERLVQDYIKRQPWGREYLERGSLER